MKIDAFNIRPESFKTSLAALACCACTAFAGLSTAQAEVKVTGPSPFANCTADNVSGQAGTNYPNAEVEPWLAANPRRPRQLLAGWQQDRWSNGGSRGLVSAYSRDGGFNWTTTVPQGITKCTKGPYDRASDPWVTISPDGTSYFMSLGFMNDETCPDGSVISGDNSMIVNRSTDGGRTWGAPIALDLDTDGQKFNDKNAMTADPRNSHFVYSSWDKLIDFTVPSECTPIVSAKSTAASESSGEEFNLHGVDKARERLRLKREKSKSKAAAPAPVEASYTGPTYFVRTTNSGKSWEPEKLIFDPGPDAQTINNLIEVLPNGTLINFFTHILADGSVELGFVKSTDKGATFGPMVKAFDLIVTANGTVTPDAEEPVRDANILFDTAVDPENGNIYVVWQDGRSGNIDRVAYSMSRNAGRSWSSPLFINATPPNANLKREQAFVPSVEVGDDHRIVVTYYDFRFDTSDGKERTDYWSITCNPERSYNCGAKSGWGKERRLTSGSFDMLDAPVARGHFLGDYQGLVRAGDRVISLFGKAVANDENDMFSTRAR